MSLKVIVNVEVAIYSATRNAWLMIQRPVTESHAPGTLSFVGGKVDADDCAIDTLESAARREVLEEVGIQINQLSYVESKMFSTAKGNVVLDVVFITSVDDAQPICTSEAETIEWLTLDEILLHPKTPPWIAASVSRIKSG